MLRSRSLSLLALVLVALAPTDPRASAQKPAPAVRSVMTAEQIARTYMPGVVTIVSEDGYESSLGSGFVVRPGVVVTNLHVVARMYRGGVTPASEPPADDPKWWISEVLAVDEQADLALLSVPEARDGLTALPMASRADAVAIGQKIYALGSPRGLSGTISEGIVSALRSENGAAFVQITAPISHGSSGGPIISDRGEVVAVAVASVTSGQNLNFAIPAAKVTALLARFDSGRRESASPTSTIDHAWKASPTVARALANATRPDAYADSMDSNPTFEAVDVVLLPPDLKTVIKEAKSHVGERLSIPSLRLLRAFPDSSGGNIRLSVEEIGTGVRQNGYGEFYFEIQRGNDLTAMREGIKKYKDAELRLDFVIVRQANSLLATGRVLGMYWLDRSGRVAHSATFPR